MAIMSINSRRSRFGALKVGEYFRWGLSDPQYRKVDSEHAERLYPQYMGKRYVFADKALVYRCKFTK